MMIRYQRLLPKFSEAYAKMREGELIDGRIHIFPSVNMERVILTALLVSLPNALLEHIDHEASVILKKIKMTELGK